MVDQEGPKQYEILLSLDIVELSEEVERSQFKDLLPEDDFL